MSTTTQRVRVVVYLRADDDGPDALERAYREISWVRPGAVPGLLCSELLRDVDRPAEFALHSEWESLEAYRTWQFGPDHKDNPSALRPFQDRSRGRHYAVYGVSSQDA
ncbi:antibiotic biosynthesis monooxygenase [Streptomyces sp. SID5785]|uniref:antibiotic biosynthesis monooxygenase family protein n=1 Tax=Streptomyces sp. SID5785 TaxID=2690309 RepID=UPI001361536E|nr:antibiotic biosynthesis monooxygenase family protein [Streptomyces sp. SID5785]MZD07210.1 antibiotic biosynthesis monooxygenase [Streptomyces sp. SID5785]